MITFQVPVQIVDALGDTTYTNVVIRSSDNPDEDWLDLKVEEPLAAGSNIVFDSSEELRHALELARRERRRVVDGAQ